MGKKITLGCWEAQYIKLTEAQYIKLTKVQYIKLTEAQYIKLTEAQYIKLTETKWSRSIWYTGPPNRRLLKQLFILDDLFWKLTLKTWKQQVSYQVSAK